MDTKVEASQLADGFQDGGLLGDVPAVELREDVFRADRLEPAWSTLAAWLPADQVEPVASSRVVAFRVDRLEPVWSAPVAYRLLHHFLVGRGVGSGLREQGESKAWALPLA